MGVRVPLSAPLIYSRNQSPVNTTSSYCLTHEAWLALSQDAAASLSPPRDLLRTTCYL